MSRVMMFQERFAPKVVDGSKPTATFADAARAFETAAALNPNRLMHRVELGRTSANRGRKADAERELSRGLAMPSVEKDDPETKARGRKILATL